MAMQAEFQKLSLSDGGPQTKKKGSQAEMGVPAFCGTTIARPPSGLGGSPKFDSGGSSFKFQKTSLDTNSDNVQRDSIFQSVAMGRFKDIDFWANIRDK